MQLLLAKKLNRNIYLSNVICTLKKKDNFAYIHTNTQTYTRIQIHWHERKACNSKSSLWALLSFHSGKKKFLASLPHFYELHVLHFLFFFCFSTFSFIIFSFISTENLEQSIKYKVFLSAETRVKVKMQRWCQLRIARKTGGDKGANAIIKITNRTGDGWGKGSAGSAMGKEQQLLSCTRYYISPVALPSRDFNYTGRVKISYLRLPRPPYFLISIYLCKTFRKKTSKDVFGLDRN